MRIGETKTETGPFQIFYKCDCPILKPKFQYLGARLPPIPDTRAFFEVCPTCGKPASQWEAFIGRYVTKTTRTGWFRKERERTVEDERPISATPRTIRVPLSKVALVGQD